VKLVPLCASDAHVWGPFPVMYRLEKQARMCSVCGLIDREPRKVTIACPDCDARGAIGAKMCRTCHGYGEIQRELTG